MMCGAHAEKYPALMQSCRFGRALRRDSSRKIVDQGLSVILLLTAETQENPDVDF